MWFHKRQDRTYVGVALTFIVIGAGIFAFGLVAWLANTFGQQEVVAIPSVKILGGLILMALGYIQLELGLIRDK